VERPDFSVVICAHSERRFAQLERAVASVERQTLSARETVLVIDHNPGLLDRARARFPGLVVAGSDKHPGLSGARNCGIERAKGRLVAFLDDDAVADPRWLESMAAAYASADVMCVGGIVDPVWKRGRPRWFPPEFDWVVGCTRAGLPEHRAPVRNVIGANMSFRREVFELAGGFRPGLGRVGSRPLGCEETELCVRLHRCRPDGVVLHDPAVRVSHDVSPERGRLRYFLARCFAEGRSKATVARLAPTSAALGPELEYSLHVLPSAVLRELRSALLRPDPAALGRAAAIVAGLTATTAGFVLDSLRPS
jgi:glycosyltransferase involved in cell wall biosynthesis